MAYLDDLMMCTSCSQETNPYPIQFIIWGENGDIMDYSSKPNPNAKTFNINYNDISAISDLVDAMFPNSYKSTKGTLTEQRNKGTNIEALLSKVAIKDLTFEVHTLVNKYKEQSVKAAGIFIRQVEYEPGKYRPDTTDLKAAKKHNYPHWLKSVTCVWE